MMLRLWKHRQEPDIQTRLPVDQAGPGARRNKQKNIKASPDCIAAFSAMAKTLHLSEAALFEDMVAERLEFLTKHGAGLSFRKK